MISYKSYLTGKGFRSELCPVTEHLPPPKLRFDEKHPWTLGQALEGSITTSKILIFHCKATRRQRPGFGTSHSLVF